MASFAMGILIWTLVEWAVFLDRPAYYAYYILTLALAGKTKNQTVVGKKCFDWFLCSSSLLFPQCVSAL